MYKRKRNEINRMDLVMPAISENEGKARALVAAFCAELDPTAADLTDIKCAVSEAVTNCIVHAYRVKKGKIYISVRLFADKTVVIGVRDCGCGIADVKRAREPLFTTDAANERSGMGFTVMENFMDGLRVHSRVGKGTVVYLTKRIGARA